MSVDPPRSFAVGVSPDVRARSGGFVFHPATLEGLTRAGIKWHLLDGHEGAIDGADLTACDALFHFGLPVTPIAVERAKHRLVLIARHGVGLDMIDIDACTRNGVAITTTPEAVRHPVASGAVALVLDLAHRVTERDRLVREGSWSKARFETTGFGLTGKVLALIGFGSIGREIHRLLTPWEMRVLVATRRQLDRGLLATTGVTQVSVDEACARADVLVVACPLTPETTQLLDARRLALMKNSAVLVNVSRGAVVDQDALTRAVRSGALRSAGLDVFRDEPINIGDPLLQLQSVVLTPHAVAYTEELFVATVGSAVESILALRRGEVSANVVNVDVLDDAFFRKKLLACMSSDP